MFCINKEKNIHLSWLTNIWNYFQFVRFYLSLVIYNNNKTHHKLHSCDMIPSHLLIYTIFFVNLRSHDTIRNIVNVKYRPSQFSLKNQRMWWLLYVLCGNNRWIITDTHSNHFKCFFFLTSSIDMHTFHMYAPFEWGERTKYVRDLHSSIKSRKMWFCFHLKESPTSYAAIR